MSLGTEAIPWQGLNGKSSLGVCKQTSLAYGKQRGEGASPRGRAK